MTQLRVAARGDGVAIALGFQAPGPAARAFTGAANGWSSESAFDALVELPAPDRFVESADVALHGDGERFAVAWRVRGPRARCGASVNDSGSWQAAADPFASTTVAGNGDDGPDLASDGSGFALRCSGAVAIWRGGAWGQSRVFAESAVGALCGGVRYALAWQSSDSSSIEVVEEDGVRWERAVPIASATGLGALRLARTSAALVVVWQEPSTRALVAVSGSRSVWSAPVRLDDGRPREASLGRLVARGDEVMAAWYERGDGAPDTVWTREWRAGIWSPSVTFESAWVQEPGPPGFSIAAMRRTPRTQVVIHAVLGGLRGESESLPAPRQVHVAVPRSHSPRVVVDRDGVASAVWIEDGLAAATPHMVTNVRGPEAWGRPAALTPTVPSGLIDLDVAIDGTRVDVAYATGAECVMLQRGVAWTERPLVRESARETTLAASGGATLVAWRHATGARAMLVRGSELLLDRELGDGVTNLVTSAGPSGHGLAFVRDGRVWMATTGAGGWRELLLDDGNPTVLGVDLATRGGRSIAAWADTTAIKARAIEGGAPFAVEIVAHERADAAPVVALGDAGRLIVWTAGGVPRASLRGIEPFDLDAPGVRAENLAAVATPSGFVVAWVVRDAVRNRVRTLRHEGGAWQRVVEVASGPPEEPILSLDLAVSGTWIALVWERGGGIWGLLTE